MPAFTRAETGLAEAPLAARSVPAGATMFTLIPAEQSGVVTENSYADPKMWAERYQEFALGAIGTGVTIGDYDNDGRPDLFIVSKTGQSRLFRNLGNWKFEDTTVRAGLAQASGGGGSWMKNLVGGSAAANDVEAWKQGASFADINNDGWLDLYVCRYAAPNLLYVNQRNGTFKEEAAARGLAIVDASGMGAFCDYDRDGWLDVYLQTNMLNAVKSPGGQRDYLLHNNGDGTFTEVTEKAGIAGENLAHSATWWDFDQDGWPDVYVANDFGPSDRLYRNNRDGTFTNVIHQVVPQMPYSAMGADFGDVNNDGCVDLLVADMATTTHEKDQRGMASSRDLSREDADSPTLAPQILRNALYLNTGLGRMIEAGALAGLAATDWTWSVRFEDLDNDGRLDLHVTNGMNREYQNADLRERIILLENEAERLRVMKAAPVLNETHLAYRNRGDLQFEEVGKKWGLDQTGVSFGAAFGDLDGDGDLDLVYANYEAGASVLRNDSQGGHRLVVALRGTTSNRFGIGATVRIETAAGVQVRPLVLARGYLSASEPIVHFGLGAETRIKSLTVAWPSGHMQRFADLAADRRLTITEPAGPARTDAPPPPAPGLFSEVGASTGLALKSDESFEPEAGQPLMPTRFDRRGPALALGDLNADGRDDLIVGGTGRQAARILFQTTGFVNVGSLPASPLDDGPLLLLDVDGDGRTDLLQTRAGMTRPAGSPDYQPSLYRNSGEGFAPDPAALPAVPFSVGAAVAADYDHDGRLDVFLGARVLPGKYPQTPRSALLHNAGGRFEDVTDAVAPALREAGLVSSALWADVDLDGWADLLLALEWGGVRYFHNDAGRGFTDRSREAGFTTAGPGWWTSLAVADFNGDGRPDFVAGNAGLNTPYQAPALLFAGRFASGGQPQLIEAYTEGEVLYPRRTSKALGAVVPTVRRRFARNDEYAKASLGQILGEDKLAAAQRYEAAQLQSGVFLSQPDGTYRFAALPRIAQVAPIQGAVAADFDGDGHADLCVVQNSYAPIPSIGRFDGGVGQLLLGDGRGGFTAAPPLNSGLIVPGDAKALVLLELNADGWPDLLLSRNNSTTQAWRNGGLPGRHSFRVLLQGPAGNPTAVGATITLELADGTRQLAVVAAGQGYYSQSTAAAFFGYPAGNLPRRLQVRWPDGTESTRELTAAPGATLTLSHP
ncbi:MAG TPA: FG-GAP-like repeat-containing protein [Lacunisphaera sp.]|nr:FG-GAP-like repeat-containing protein [Lacunisphaera sp.]